MSKLNVARSCAKAVASLALLFATAAHASGDRNGPSSDTPAISPSRPHEVAFSADFTGPTRIWVASLDGTGLRQVSRTPLPTHNIAHTTPAWSPDGQRLAYVETLNGVSDVWVMQADGAYPVRLTSNGANNTQPHWSPDGTTIVFVSDKQGTKDLWLMNANGSNQRQLTALAGQENSPKFSPAGDSIVFSETAEGLATLMVVGTTAGSTPRHITPTGARDWEPHWGTAGIAFASNRGFNNGWKLWAVNPDGTNLRKLGDTIGHDPVWVSDGRIVFTDETSASRALSSIAVLNLSNGNRRFVVDVQGFMVPIEIRPGKQPPKKVNPLSKGKLNVAILSSATWNALTQVKQSSLTFGRTGDEISLRKCQSKGVDANRDGIADLVCRFDLKTAGFRRDSAVGVLRFLDVDDKPYEGRGDIVTVAEDDPEDLLD